MSTTSWLKSLFSASAGGFVKDVSEAVKPFITTKGDILQLENVLEALLQKRDSEIEETIRSELGSKERIMVAELTQDDKWTKRARPILLYSGVVFTALNHSLIPLSAKLIGVFTATEINAQDWVFELPEYYWIAWGGAASLYTIGRSAEKRGIRNRVVSAITGNKYQSKLLD